MENNRRTLFAGLHQLLMPTLFSIICFCLISLASFLFSKEGQTNFSVGFPYRYYEQFRVSGSDTNNWGSSPLNFILDAILTWTVSVVVYFYFVRRGSKSKG